MSKPNIVLMCENNHYDALTHVAEYAVLQRLDKHKWTHSLVECAKIVDIAGCNVEAPSNVTSFSLGRQSQADLCFRSFGNEKHMFHYSFKSFDFDPPNDNRNQFFQDMNLCPQLDTLFQDPLIYSKLLGQFLELINRESTAETAREKQIVENLKTSIYLIGENYAIGFAGKVHCVDLHHHLKENNSTEILQKIRFINLKSGCSDTKSPDILESTLYTYYFSDCKDDTRVGNIIKNLKALNYSDDSDDNDKDARREADFENSEHVTTVNLSIAGEPASILPWQLADMGIFND